MVTYPAVTTTTRYFRKTVTYSNYANYFALFMHVKTNAGFILYVNGQVANTFGLPSTGVTTSTLANVNGTAQIERSISTLRTIFINSATIELGVEVHASADTTTGDETFDCSIVFDNTDNNRRIDAEGTASVSAQTNPSSGGEGHTKVFDGLTSTKWCFTTTTVPWVAWQFNNGRRELINKYAVSSANDTPTRDPAHWKIYGSDDMETWVLLDERSSVSWTSRYQTQTFTMNNYVSYNAYKFEFLERSGYDYWDMYQFSEWNLMLSNQPFVQPGISYSPNAYTFSMGTDNVNIEPEQTSGYSTWTITPSLPNGLTINANTGAITGSPTSGLTQTTFTVSAIYSVTGASYETTLSITIVACVLPDYIVVQFTKTNPTSTTEGFNLKNANGDTVLTFSGEATTGQCLAVGTYTLSLTTSSGTTWQASSYVTASIMIADHTHTIMRARMNEVNPTSFPLGLVIPLGAVADSNGVKYLADGTVPADWTSASFNPTGWTTLPSSPRPSVTSQALQFFTTSFTVSNRNTFQGYELSLKARAGVLVYLNGKEIYRRYLPEGAITTSTTATGGAITSSWRSITGVMSDLVDGSNVLSIALVAVSAESTTIDFDVFLRLMGESSSTPRYFSNAYTTSGPSDVANLFDFDLDTRSYVSKSTDPTPSYTIIFSNEYAETFNVYCLDTNWDAPQYDPKDWTISASNDGQTWTSLATAAGVTFDTRSDKYCFYMPTNKKAYSQYKMSVNSTRLDDTYTALANLNFFLENLDAVTVPDLSFTPSVLVGYTGAAFPEVAASSEYYSGFTIEPALPEGLVLNSNTGAIQGVLSQPYSATTFTISAINHLGETKTTTVSVAVEICGNDKIAFTLEFYLETGANACSFELKDLATGTIVESRPNLINWMTFTIPMCREATTYALVLKHTGTSGWGANRVYVKLADGTTLLSESLAAGVSSKEYDFNPAYSVAPLFTEWSYLVDGTPAPSGWNTVSGAPSWSTAMPGSFPVATGVTQYYYKKFTVSSMSDFALLDITVTVKAGAVIYLNGQEIRRYNMPEGTVDSTTQATKDEVVPMSITTGEFLQHDIVVEGENILAVELHRYESNEAVNSFDGSAIMILDNMYMLINGVGESIPAKSGDQGGDKMFDNNSSTVYKSAEADGCVGVIAQYTFDNNRREPLTNYGLVSGGSCLEYTPSGWEVSGSNDGENWQLLHVRSAEFFTGYYEQKRFSMFNSIPYNKYRVTVTSCNNPVTTACGGSYMQLADVYFFAKRLDGYCAAIGEFQPALNGDASYVSCPELYEGNRIRYCTDGVFSDEVNDCHPLAPSGILYEQTALSLYQGKAMTPVIPQIVAKEYTVSSFPSMPDGLTLGTTDGSISGTPSTVQELQRYTVTVKNEGGSAQTVITIEVLEAPTNWVMIIVIAVVAVIVVVAVVVAIVLGCKKSKDKKATKKMPKSTKAAPKPASVKTKAAVKV